MTPSSSSHFESTWKFFREDPNLPFLALDFETANYHRSSACSIGLVLIENGQIVLRFKRLIRPPTLEFSFTYLHGISASDVICQPTFAELWPEMVMFFNRADFIVAHNAAFDKSVLKSCLEMSLLEVPPQPFLCTVQLARKIWNIKPTRLSDVCRHLSIPLRHHNAMSDAEACAKIVMAASRLS